MRCGLALWIKDQNLLWCHHIWDNFHKHAVVSMVITRAWHGSEHSDSSWVVIHLLVSCCSPCPIYIPFHAIFGPNTYMLTGACLPSASTLSYRASYVCGGSHHCFHNLSSVLSFLATFIAKIIIGNIIMFAILLHCSHAGNTSIFQLGR